MDTKKELKKVYMDILEGNLKTSMQLMQSLPSELKQDNKNRICINIFCHICKLTAEDDYKPQKQISISDLRDTILIIYTKLKTPIVADINNYMKSLFHILKYLLKQVPFDDLYQFCEYILPPWITELTDEVYDLLTFYSVLLNNDIIVPLAQKKETELLLKYTFLHLRLYKFIFVRNPLIFFTKFQTYCGFFQKFQMFDHFPGYCLKIYNLLDDIKKLPDKETATECYNTFCMIICMYFSNFGFKFGKIKSYTDKTFDLMAKFSKFDNELMSCTNILYSFYNLYARNLEEYKRTDVELFKKLQEDFENLIKTYGYSSAIKTTNTHMFRMIRTLFETFENTEKNIWNYHMTPEIQIECVKLIQLIGQVSSKTDIRCDCSKNCKIKQDITHAVITLNRCVTLLNLSMKHESDNIDELQEIIYLVLRDNCKYIEKIKMLNCERWVVLWKTVAANIYNVASRFYRLNSYKLAKNYYFFLCRYIIILEGTDNDNYFMENSLGTVLQYIGLCYFNTKQYRNALTYLALSIKLCPSFQEHIWQYWCTVKASASKENIENINELTINYILENDTDFIKQLYPPYVYNKYEMLDLLLLEIKSYVKIWASKIPMCSACNDLFSICSDPVQRIYAINLCWEKVISLQDENFIENVNKTIIMFNKKDIRNKLLTQVYLSVLYYIDYQYKMYETLKKNLNEMNSTIRDEKPLQPYEEQNPNDKCDVIPTYYNNKIENIIHLQKILNKSIDLWNKILENVNLDSVKNIIEELNIPLYIKNTAFEFRLQNFTYQMYKIWFLYLKYGRLFDNKDIILTAIGFILELAHFNTQTVQEMIEAAENLIKDINDLEIFATYYINKSTGQLRCNLLKEGLQSLQTAEKYHKELQTVFGKVDKKLEARILLLKSLYLRKPCILNLMKHTDNYIVYLQEAFASIADFYKTEGSRCHYTLSILFDLSYNVGDLYKWLRMPREIRCYTSESVLLAQQMVLPLRTVEFFSLLAFTDLFGCLFDDCRVKMSGIDYMLCHRSNYKIPRSPDIKVAELQTEFENIVLRSDNFETLLDVPVEHKIKNLHGSPILSTKPFKMPSFIYHLNCNCSYCTNVDYQRLVLECTHLEAVFHLQGKNIQVSSDFFKGSINLYNGILRKYENVLNKELIEPFKKTLLITYAQVLLDYSYFYAKQRDYDLALKYNNLACEILGTDLESNTYFYNAILKQQINLLSAAEYEKTLLTKQNSKSESDVDYDGPVISTPTNKMSVAKITLSLSPCEDLPTPKRSIKKLIFDLSSDEDKEKSPEVKNKIFKFKTPAKTPAPKVAKIKVYIPTPKQSKIKPMSLEVSPKINVDNKEIKNGLLKNLTNPESKLETQRNLQKRTKLLTEKLRAEKGILKEPNRLPSKVPKRQKESTKISDSQKENIETKISKNLIDDLSDGVAKLELFDQVTKEHLKIEPTENKVSTPQIDSEPKDNPSIKPLKTYSRTQKGAIKKEFNNKTEPEKETDSQKIAPKGSSKGAIKKEFSIKNEPEKETESQDIAPKGSNRIQRGAIKKEFNIKNEPKKVSEPQEIAHKGSTRIQRDAIKKELNIKNEPEKETEFQEIAPKESNRIQRGAIKKELNIKNEPEKETEFQEIAPKESSRIQRGAIKKDLNIKNEHEKETEFQEIAPKGSSRIQRGAIKKELNIKNEPEKQIEYTEIAPKGSSRIQRGAIKKVPVSEVSKAPKSRTVNKKVESKLEDNLENSDSLINKEIMTKNSVQSTKESKRYKRIITNDSLSSNSSVNSVRSTRSSKK